MTVRGGRILFHVQHLLGTGHLRRAAAVARALADAGLEVTLASGGLPVRDIGTGGARLFQLPPLAALDERFSGLADAEGRPIGERERVARRDRLLALYREVRPHALIIEAYPFARRQLEFELLPLLDAARRAEPRPLVVSSVRDIVQRKSARRVAAMAERAERDFDLVLVHGDPAIVPLEASFPAAARFADRLHYTGYVASPAAARGGPGDPGWGEVVVSAGGGAVGAALLDAALAARPLTRLAATTWRLLAGPNLGAADFARLAGRAPGGVVVERARADFGQLLANCAVSVSQAGYNTATDILAAGARSVLVPFAGHGETEQGQRAERLARLGYARVVAEDDLGPETLAAAVEAALDGPAPTAARPRMDGAEESARLLARRMGGMGP